MSVSFFIKKGVIMKYLNKIILCCVSLLCVMPALGHSDPKDVYVSKVTRVSPHSFNVDVYHYKDSSGVAVSETYTINSNKKNLHTIKSWKPGTLISIETAKNANGRQSITRIEHPKAKEDPKTSDAGPQNGGLHEHR